MTFGRRQPQRFEARRAPRYPSNIPAIIILDTGIQIDCVITNYSTSGAMLLVATIFGIPAEFQLAVGRDAPRRVQVVRRTARRLGVKLT
jgi:hypothetical protein